MRLSRSFAAMSVTFDDPNLMSVAGLVPTMRLAENVDLSTLADSQLTVPTDKGTEAGAKVASLMAGMVAGADSIDDMALLRHGGTNKIFTTRYAPSTLGLFLRQFTFGHVRQLDALASRMLTGLSSRTPLFRTDPVRYVCVDVDDTIIEVQARQKQCSGYGYSGVRGINAMLATVSTTGSAGHRRPVSEQGSSWIPTQPTLFDIHRFHAFFTTCDLDVVITDKPHRSHAIFEQVNVDLKDNALAHTTLG